MGGGLSLPFSVWAVLISPLLPFLGGGPFPSSSSGLVVPSSPPLGGRPVHASPFWVVLVSLPFCCAVLKVGATLLQGVCITGCPASEQETQLASAAFSRPEPQFLRSAHAPVKSCKGPRRHGRITHQPEDVPVWRVWPRPAVDSSAVARVIEVWSP